MQCLKSANANELEDIDQAEEKYDMATVLMEFYLIMCQTIKYRFM